MAFINFDCPECGHNLEVDERGAGFIVKCPECHEPIQIPDMPSETSGFRRHARTIAAVAVIVLLAAAAAWGAYASRAANARAAAAEAEAADLRDRLDDASEQLELRLAAQQIQQKDKTQDRIDAVEDRARAILDLATTYLRALDDAENRLIENSKRDQEAIVRADVRERLEEAKAALPAAPEFGDAEAGRGLQNSGRTLLFPALVGAKGQTLRENAEITGIDGDQVSVRFGGGTATYRLSELHPGIVAYLPAVDPVLLVPPVQRKAEAIRLHQLEAARRADELATAAHDLDMTLQDIP